MSSFKERLDLKIASSGIDTEKLKVAVWGDKSEYA